MSLARIKRATSALVAPAATTTGSGIIISRASMWLMYQPGRPARLDSHVTRAFHIPYYLKASNSGGDMTRLTQLLWIAAALAAPLTPIATAQAPTARRGFWGAFGLGYGANGLSCSGGCVGVASFQLSQGSSTTSADGIGFLTGLGYDIRVSRKVSLSPIANFYFGHDGDLTDASGTIPGIRHAIVDFGLSVQYN